MTRSPLAYPLNRGADMDVGGAADLQTDVMRFMAILSLCLVAIFALVQSVPISAPVEVLTAPEPVPEAVVEATPEPKPELVQPVEEVSLTRPKWVPIAEASKDLIAETAAPAEEVEGFTLRFESDAVLTRLVAASQVGVYAIDGERARRMTVSESRISFWDASLPGSFHEMEVSTVPLPVVDALARTGIDTGNISWGVTLPGKLKGQLEELLLEHRGGSLVIESNGNIRLEAP